MTRKILIIDGHPDGDAKRLCHALAQAYEQGATGAGAETRLMRLADMRFPLLGSAAEFATQPDDPGILSLRASLEWADHIVFVFPLWLGSAPAKVRAMLEQVSRGDFVAATSARGWKPHLRGKSARLIVTMGMPAIVYRRMFGAHGVKSIAKSILGFAGIKPIRTTLLGAIEVGGEAAGRKRIARVAALGRRCA